VEIEKLQSIYASELLNCSYPEKYS